MYHIKSDKRSQTSAEVIINGIHRCLKRIPLNSITVSDIHRETGISRATFYRLFDTPEDVLIYQLDKMVGQMSVYFEERHSMSPLAAFEGMILQGLQYPEMLEALVKNGRIDLLITYTEDRFRLFEQTYKPFPNSMKDDEREYMVTNLCMNLVATLVTWVRRGQKETPEQVVQYVKQHWRLISMFQVD